MKNHTCKKYTKLYWVLPLATVLIASGCKKDQTDYRNKYVGNWNFQVEKVNYDVSAATEYENVTYTGPVSTVGDDKLNIHYTSGNSTELTVNQFGNLSSASDASVNCSGHFDEAGKMSLSIRWGSQTSGVRHNINGQKQ